MRSSLAILALGPESIAVGERGLQPIKIAPQHIDSPIGDQTS